MRKTHIPGAWLKRKACCDGYWNEPIDKFKKKIPNPIAQVPLEFGIFNYWMFRFYFFLVITISIDLYSLPLESVLNISILRVLSSMMVKVLRIFFFYRHHASSGCKLYFSVNGYLFCCLRGIRLVFQFDSFFSRIRHEMGGSGCLLFFLGFF